MDFLNDESDDESETYKLFGGKEGIVFLIEATKPMFVCQQFSLAIQCVENVMKNKAIASPSDELAVILFGTENHSNDDSFQHIFVSQSLQKTSAQLILDLKQLLSDDFETKLGHNNGYSLADVFSTAISQFTKSKSRFQTKRVILFTCCPEPHSGNTPEARHLRKISINRAKDFKDHEIEVQLIPLSSKDNRVFDVEAFYQDVFPDLKDDTSDTLTKLEPLLKRIHSHSYKQRMLASVPFRLGPSTVQMSVYVYSLYLEAKKPTTIAMNRKDYTEVKPSTERWTQDVGAIVPKEEMSKKIHFGNENIFLKPNDVKAMKAFEEPALTLLGFKPRTALKAHLHIRPAHFIYPNESAIKGSSTLFNALLKRCTERNKIAICRFTLRRSAPPSLVALCPQTECIPEGRFGGFSVVYLPFKDDIRELSIKGAEELPLRPEAIDLAKNIVEKLTFNYESKNFPNPVLQTHWRTIEALALNYTDVEPFDDSQTQPDYDDIEAKAGYDLYSLNQLLGGFTSNPMVKKVEAISDERMRVLCQTNQLKTLNIPQLKQFCKEKDIRADGQRKAIYIESIRHYYKM